MVVLRFFLIIGKCENFDVVVVVIRLVMVLLVCSVMIFDCGVISFLVVRVLNCSEWCISYVVVLLSVLLCVELCINDISFCGV